MLELSTMKSTMLTVFGHINNNLRTTNACLIYNRGNMIKLKILLWQIAQTLEILKF